MGRTDGLAAVGSRFGEFTVTGLLHQSERSLVLRCVRGEERLVVKLLRAEPVQAADVARLRREFELSRRLDHPHIVSASHLASHEGVLYLAMPDDGALALRELLRQGPLAPRDALRTALGVVDALEAVHAINVIHKDIAPGNIVVDFAAGTVKLIDFGIAAELSSERPEPARPEDLEGTLASMAPEQSGRMNRDVDYRADFYGLGATLFEMLVGAAPFAFADPVQAVHAHLAQAPPLLTELRPDLPELLGALVARLLAKEPEARYQSHAVLRRDLQHLLEHLDNPARLSAYQLAVDDLPERFQVSGRLYGRAQEAARIVAVFEAAARGPAQLFTIAGVSGIGKTALVNEVQRSLLGHRGNFVSGKFNQFGQHAPYGAFIQALQQRARQILALPEEEQARWCEALMDALGANAALAVKSVPDLDRLLGPLPPVLALAPAEAENRFLRAMQSCFAALANAAQPLVLFVDDLQWADRSSRRLLRELAQDSLLRHVLVIGAYRSNEVPADHPLVYDLAALAAAGTHVSAVELGPLAEEDVCHLLADTLHRRADDVRELASLCQAKTGGNPFFLRRFLEDVHQRGLIWLDRGATQWEWALARIRAEHIADNVVELMVEQLLRLPPATGTLLNIAACLGGRFELRTLAIASGQTEESVLLELAPALQASMLVGTDTHYKWAGVLHATERPDLRVELAFVHDRVQEAAYALTALPERPALHLRIGRLLRAAAPADQPAFAVVNHLNLGQELMRIAAERTQLAQLNLEASERARDAAAFDLAADYAEQAISLHGPNYWRTAHAPALAAHVHAARMAYLGGRPERMEALIAAAMPHARSPLEQARLMDVRIESFYASGQLGQTLDVGLAVLRLLGVEPPAAATPERAARLVANIKTEIETLGIGALSARPPMTDPLCLQQISVAAKMTAAAYIARPALLPLLTVLQVRLMMSRGHAPAALSAYSVMGLMAAEFLRDYRFGYALGQMSLDLVERHGWRQVQAHAAFSFNTFLRHWIEPVANGLPALLEVDRNGQEFGNLRHAGLGLYMHGYHALLAGEPLVDLAPVLQEHAATLRRIRQPVAHDYLSVLAAVVAELQQERLSPQPLEGAGFSAAQLEQTYTARGDQTGGMFVHAFRCMLHALAGRPAEAVVAGEAAATLFSAARGMYMVPFCVFFTATSSLIVAQRLPAEQRQQRRAQAGAAMARFDLWVQTSSDLVPLARLLKASLLAFDGQAEAAQVELDGALAAAERLGNLFLLGLVRWHRGLALDVDADPLAEGELAEARTLFLRWGARALAAAVRLPSAASMPEAGRTAAPPTMPASALDLATLMKAVQAVTAEIELGPLLERMLAVLREDAGARRAAIVLKDAQHWVLQADSDSAGRTRVLEGLALENAAERLPLEIVRTVLNTASPVLIEDLDKEPRWKRLSYFAQRGGRSVLCVPLTQQGRTVGALQLENDAIANAFSPARMQFLEFLSGNVVNAIENARLYEQLRGLAGSLEQRVTERTRELQESEARTLSILQNAPMPMSVTRRADGILVYANERAAAVTGYTPGELIGSKAAARYRDAADRERLYAKYRTDGLLRDEEICLVAQDGSDRWTLISMVPIVYDGEPADLAAVVDITERKAIEETLRRLATTDALTGVANRGHFMQRASAELERARRYGRPLSVVMLDIDHFKQINDRHGHAGGDEVLRAVTATCVGLVRQQDTVGRLGGEEFALLMPETEIEPATLLAERLRTATAALHVTLISGERVSLSASFGVSALQAEDSVDTLLARADGALYASKNGGRNRVSVG